MDCLRNANFEPFKLPIGAIRIPLFILVIIAFSTCCNYRFSNSYQATQPQNFTGPKLNCTKVSVSFSYPFNLAGVQVSNDSCEKDPKKRANVNLFSSNYASQSMFFVATGVLSFLFILASLFLYLFMWEAYENNPNLPSIDFFLTIVFTVFWFAAVIAFGAAVTGIRGTLNGMGTTEFGKIDKACAKKNYTCEFADSWGYGNLYISVIAAFGCWVVFALNCWFVFKETKWRKGREAPPAPPPGAPPSGPKIESASAWDPNNY